MPEKEPIPEEAHFKKIPISELSPEEKKEIERLEEITDVIWGERSELAGCFEELKETLPEEFVKDPERLKEIFEDGKLFQIIREKVEDSLVNKSKEELQREINIRTLEAEENISEAIELYKNLETKDEWIYKIKKLKEAKTKEERKKIFEEMPEELKLISYYKWFRLRELARGKRLFKYKDKRLREIFFEKRLAADKNFTKAVRRLVEEEIDLLNEKKDLINRSPELFLWTNIQKLIEAKRVLEKGGIVETPYVKKTINLILDELQSGRVGVFIHGELGAGKTDLARHISREYLSEKYLERWEKEHPKPTDPKELEKWELAREAAKDPYFIHGHKGFTVAEALGEKMIKQVSKLSPEERVKIIEKGVNIFIENYKKERKESPPKDLIDELKKAYEDEFKTGFEVAYVLGPLYRAMKEGRPIIMDELNAIPHTVLIVFNELLRVQPGQRIQPIFPGIEPFEVKEGFCVLATGNWRPEDGRIYVGRQTMDAAFLSRLGLIYYDYLPQLTEEKFLSESELKALPKEERKKELEKIREKMEENELFLLLVALIIDKDLGIRAPKDTLEKVKGLAKAARILQDICSGKEAGEVIFHDPVQDIDLPAKELLEENVLSIRHLLPILTAWKKEGFVRPLEHYIIRYYLSRSKARPSEFYLIYHILQYYSGETLFPTKEWPDSAKAEDKEKILELDPRKFIGTPKKEEIPPQEYIPPKKVIEELFGPVPEREEISKEVYEKLFGRKEEIKTSEEIAYEELEKINEELNEVKEEIKKVIGKINPRTTEEEKNLLKEFETRLE